MRDGGDLFQRHSFLETQQDGFALLARDLMQSAVQLGSLLMLDSDVKCTRTGHRRFRGRWQVLDRLRPFATDVVDGQVARYGHQPGNELMTRIVAMTLLQDADPGFLEDVFGGLTVVD